MEPIIEIVLNNIMYNNLYDQHIKTEFMNTINRITYSEKIINQYKTSMDFILFHNTINEEIKFLSSKKKYFYKNLNKDIKYIVNDYIKHIMSNYKTLDISI